MSTKAKKSTATKAATTAHTASAPASHDGTGASVWKTHASVAGTKGTRALELVADGSLAGEVGLTGALLELVGTERLTLAHALSAWQREQDRLANRTWRRPGGLVRLAGL